MRIIPVSLTIIFLTVVSGGFFVVNRRLQDENQRLRAQYAKLLDQATKLDAAVKQMAAERQQLQQQDAEIRKGIDHEFDGIDGSKVHSTINW